MKGYLYHLEQPPITYSHFFNKIDKLLLLGATSNYILSFFFNNIDNYYLYCLSWRRRNSNSQLPSWEAWFALKYTNVGYHMVSFIFNRKHSWKIEISMALIFIICRHTLLITTHQVHTKCSTLKPQWNIEISTRCSA